MTAAFVTGDPAFDAGVEAALSRVNDPCSIAAGRPTSLVDMGLVRGWRLGADGTLHVTFGVTFAGCTMAPHFITAAQAELGGLPGVTRVEASVDTAFAWTSDHMRANARPVMVGEPQAWRQRAAAPRPEPSMA